MCKIIDAIDVTEILLKRPLISLLVSVFFSFFGSSFITTMPFLVFRDGMCPITVKVIPKLIAFCYDVIFIKYTCLTRVLIKQERPIRN